MFSRLLRQMQVYLGLAPAPWILLFALGTLAMNRREWQQRVPETGRMDEGQRASHADTRITYTLADGPITIEKSQFSTEAFLERMHRRRGDSGLFVADNGWAVSVVAVGMTF